MRKEHNEFHAGWNIAEEIEREKRESKEFAEKWDKSRAEYRLIGEMISLRKRQRLTQSDLAKMLGNTQQVISRIERKIHTPTLRFFCEILDVLGYELQIVKKA